MGSITTDKVYFKYLTYTGNYSRFLIDSYKFAGDIQWTRGFTPNKIPEGKIRVLLCKGCKSNNWTHNGNFCNEFECNSCGNFVEVTERRRGEDK